MPLVGVGWNGSEWIQVYQEGVDGGFFHRIYPFVTRSILIIGW